MNLAVAAHAAVEAGVLNAYDRPIIASLVGVNYLTPAQLRMAWVILSRYKFQLGQLNIDLSGIPEPHVDSWDYPRSIYLAEEDSFGIVFPFDPGLVARVKLIPGRSYQAKPNPHWLVPVSPQTAPPLIEFATKNRFVFNEDILVRLGNIPIEEGEFKANVTASTLQEADIEIPGLGGVLRPYQKAAVTYALKNPHTIIADEMGIGKTVESLATLQAANAFPALVICPASAKGVWINHSRKWLPDHPAIVLEGNNYEPGYDVVITNYDQLKKWEPFLTATDWRAVILDEVHYLQDPESARGKLSAKIASDRPMIIMLSGTPMLNRPVELVHPLNILGILPKFGGFWAFVTRYCDATQKVIYVKGGQKKKVWDLKGNSHTAELHEKMQGAGVFLRRLKKDVLSELPPKQRAIIPIEITNKAEYLKEEREMVRELKSGAKFVALTRFEALKQIANRGKMSFVIDWVADFLESGEKLVVFAWHREVVEQVASKFNAPMVYGGMTDRKKNAVIETFQNDPGCRLIVCNILSGGEAITLTAASNALFVELPWNPSKMLQAEDRLHRLGQKDSVNAWYMLDQSTVDGEVWDIITEKWGVVESVTDGGAEDGGDWLVNKVIARILERYKEE